MNKTLEMNDDQRSIDIPLYERITTEIVTLIKTAAKEDLADFESEVSNIERVQKIRHSYASRLEEKKAHLETERSITGSNADIVESLQRRRNLEREIAEVELSIKELDTEFWPVPVKAADIARERITQHLGPIVFEMKNKYQAQLDALFLESIAIMEAFRNAVYDLSHKPEFRGITGEVSNSLTSFDLNILLFNKMNDLHLSFGMMPETKTNKHYQAVICFKEQVNQ